MLRYTTDRARPGLVASYDIRPGNGAGQFLQPWGPHGAHDRVGMGKNLCRNGWGWVRTMKPAQNSHENFNFALVTLTVAVSVAATL